MNVGLDQGYKFGLGIAQDRKKEAARLEEEEEKRKEERREAKRKRKGRSECSK